jgi:hypothetical protein
MEEEDMNEHAPFPPCQGVYKKDQLTGQSDKGVHNNTDNSSDDELIPTPPAPPRNVQERATIVWHKQQYPSFLW